MNLPCDVKPSPQSPSRNEYVPKDLSKNLLASLVLLLIGIPLNLGVALASGVSPAAGLTAGIVSALVLGLLSGCPLQVSGPAAGLIAVVYEIVSQHGVGMLGPVVLAAGLVQIFLGMARLAPWFRAVSPAVIQGMMAGIGVLIFAGQLQVVFERKPFPTGIANLAAIPDAFGRLLLDGHAAGSVALATVTILGIVLWGLFKPKRLSVIPGSLMGVIVAVAAAAAFKPDVQYVNLPDNPLSNLHLIDPRSMLGLAHPSVLGQMVAVFFIATAQTLLTATAVDRYHTGPRTDYNKEIIAQGLANSICGVLGALPVCGMIVRSSANLQAGATNRSSNFFHGIWVALFTLFLAPWLSYVPLAALAGVLVYTGFRLIDLKAVKQLKKFGKAEFAIYLVTAICIVFVELLTGIVIGFLLSAARLIYVLTHYQAETTENPVNGSLVLSLKGSATFFTLPRLADDLAALPPKREVHLFMSGLNHIDHACLEHLMGWEELYIQQGGQVFIEWDHLITRFHKPKTHELGLDIESQSQPKRQHETYDVLAARAQIVDLQRAAGWHSLAEAISLSLDSWVPNYQRQAIQQGLREQFESGAYLREEEVLLPHLMLAGIARHEMVLVRLQEDLSHLEPGLQKVRTIVALLGPLKTSEHLNILARLSNRVDEGLADDVAAAETRPQLRRALLKHRKFVNLILNSSQPSQVFIDKAVWQVSKKLPSDTLIAQIYRDGQDVIPSGSTVLKAGDKLLILGAEPALEQIAQDYLEDEPQTDSVSAIS